MKRETIHAAIAPNRELRLSAGPFEVTVENANDAEALYAAAQTLLEASAGFSRADVLVAALTAMAAHK